MANIYKIGDYLCLLLVMKSLMQTYMAEDNIVFLTWKKYCASLTQENILLHLSIRYLKKAEREFINTHNI